MRGLSWRKMLKRNNDNHHSRVAWCSKTSIASIVRRWLEMVNSFWRKNLLIFALLRYRLLIWATFFFGMQRFSKECCSNFCRESISAVFCLCAKPREATSESTYKSGKIVFAKALCAGYQTERFFHMFYYRYVSNPLKRSCDNELTIFVN